jgi:hypothetical protein
MGRRAKTQALLLAATGAALVWVLPAGADTNPAPPGQQLCPAPGGLDPDTVALSGPANLWPPNGRRTTYTLTAAETKSEQSGDPAPHYVTVDYRVTASPSGHLVASGSSPETLVTDPTHNNASATLSFALRAAPLGPGHPWTYLVSWDATFDGGVHTCSSVGVGEHPFAVKVARPSH